MRNADPEFHHQLKPRVAFFMGQNSALPAPSGGDVVFHAPYIYVEDENE